jgi:hypothetical protein
MAKFIINIIHHHSPDKNDHKRNTFDRVQLYAIIASIENYCLTRNFKWGLLKE